jgi:hypothetical protein
LDPDRPIVLYTTGMPQHMPGEPVLVEDLAEHLSAMRDLGPPQLAIRVYPKDRTDRWSDLRRRREEVIFLPTAWEPEWLTPLRADVELLTNSIKHADVGVNVASTVSLELCMFDKPVVNVAYNPGGVDVGLFDFGKWYEYDHYKPVVESRAVRVARSKTEMGTMVRDALSNPAMGQEHRQALLETMFADTLDGCSAERVSDCLYELSNASKVLE